MDPAGVETVFFARVKQAIADLLNTVKAIEWRDRLKAVAAAAAVLNRHDIRAAAARAVAEVERWIAKQARSPCVRKAGRRRRKGTKPGAATHIPAGHTLSHDFLPDRPERRAPTFRQPAKLYKNEPFQRTRPIR